MHALHAFYMQVSLAIASYIIHVTFPLNLLQLIITEAEKQINSSLT